MKIAIISSLSLMLMVVGCGGSTTLHWSKPDVSYEQFMLDRYSCLLDSRQKENVDSKGVKHPSANIAATFLGCMAAHGYRITSSGEFAPPSACTAELEY